MTARVSQDTPLSRLASTLELCQPLLASSHAALRVFPGAQDDEDLEPDEVGFDDDAIARCNEVLSAIAASCGLLIPQFVWPAPARPSSLEVALSNFCELDPDIWYAISALPGSDALTSLVGGLVLPPGPDRRTVQAEGLPPFESWSSGDPDDEAIVVIAPCRVPAALFRPWLSALSARYFVVVYENPYLFGNWQSLPAPSGELASEAGFVAAVLHDHGIQRAHLIGICGGAPIALAAAAELGPRVASVVVCHADLNFGAQVPRTPFQQQFQGFLCDAATSLERAKAVLDMFLDPNMLFGMPAPLAPFIVYPYCDLELFYRYAKINHGLMAYNASEVARRLDQRVLIVTSRTDRMTHPASSYYLHRIVNDSELSERETGSHHDVLLPDQELFTTILEFVGADVGATSLAARQ